MSTVEIGGQVYEHRTLLQTLESIKRLLRKHWTQGRYGNRLFLGEGFCLVGARLAIDGPHERKVKQLFQQVVPASFRTVEEYNDHHGRTKKHIMTFMDRCIAKATTKRPAKRIVKAAKVRAR